MGNSQVTRKQAEMKQEADNQKYTVNRQKQNSRIRTEHRKERTRLKYTGRFCDTMGDRCKIMRGEERPQLMGIT